MNNTRRLVLITRPRPTTSRPTRKVNRRQLINVELVRKVIKVTNKPVIHHSLQNKLHRGLYNILNSFPGVFNSLNGVIESPRYFIRHPISKGIEYGFNPLFPAGFNDVRDRIPRRFNPIIEKITEKFTERVNRQVKRWKNITLEPVINRINRIADLRPHRVNEIVIQPPERITKHFEG